MDIGKKLPALTESSLDTAVNQWFEIAMATIEYQQSQKKIQVLNVDKSKECLSKNGLENNINNDKSCPK